MLKRERKALVACRKGHNRALGQRESQLLLPARHLSFHGGNLSYLVTWVPLPAVHQLYKPPLWNSQDDHIHLYSLEQNKADSGFSAQGWLKPLLQTRLSPKQRGACRSSSLHIPHTPSQKHQHTAGAKQVLTPPAVTGNAKWGADGWAGSRSSNQS